MAQFSPPISDNTYLSPTGHFMIANGLKVNHFARLFSEYLQSTSVAGVCLTFYYYFDGCNQLKSAVFNNEFKLYIIFSIFYCLFEQLNL